MKVKVLLFGIFSEKFESSSQYFEDITSTNDLLSKMHGMYPTLKDMSYTIAVNQHIINKNTKLDDGDEVALMPPFAGG